MLGGTPIYRGISCLENKLGLLKNYRDYVW